MKCFWIYVCDNCNFAGIWDIDFESAEFMIGEKLDIEVIKKEFEKQYQILNNNKWFIKDFVDFQYKHLGKKSNTHKAVLEELEKYNITLAKGLRKGCPTLQDTVTVTVTDTVKVKDFTRNPPNSKKYELKTDVQKVLAGYKILKGFKFDDRDWDKLNFRRCSKPAKQLIDFFKDGKLAIDCIQEVGAVLDKKKLSWTLETIIKFAAQWKQSQENNLEFKL